MKKDIENVNDDRIESVTVYEKINLLDWLDENMQRKLSGVKRCPDK